MEGESLTEAQIERLGNSLMRLKETIEELKEEQGICEAVGSLRKQLDGLVNGSVWSERPRPPCKQGEAGGEEA